jgi:hypothetical protein
VITNNSLTKFFKRNGFYSLPSDIKNIMHRLDVNYDNCLEYDEFAKAILVFDIDGELLRTENLASAY